jgi:hypothetical protein
VCGLVSLGFGSCGGAPTGSGGAVDAGAITDSAVRSDAAVPDSAISFDAGLEDSAVPQESGDEAYSCGEPYTDLGGKCDDCIETNCEPVWCACATDPPDAADDGGTGCLHYVKCVEECVAQDAGSPTDCLGTICAIAPSTASEQQAGHAYLDCMIQYCATNCGQ